MTDHHFYLGRWLEGEEPVQYDPADLTTHAVVIGMTGSGKTGLLIALLEEAARQGLPAIVVDPKGDLTNLLLHFPALRAEDFSPWIDPEAARRQGMTPGALAESTAARWREGLARWGLGTAELQALKDAVDYTVYTPGSTSGTPVNLLSSFSAPEGAEGGLGEAGRERISSTVTALLGLVGMDDVDPLRSREHILLANIFERAWSAGHSLDLAGLIEGVQNPPFDRLGAFPLERFFPEKERFELALLLNNFLAAPSFQPWLAGQPLDVQQLLYLPDGKPRFAVFYLAHLSETERMFFVTLLLAAVEGWMRGQRGSSGLRALLAFDEIVGYLPPVANPPSRPVLLRLLKQARAFGLGLVLSTQNPSDLNYKALSNAGTWFIGRLQTERDRLRLLDGLESLESAINRAAFDRLIAGLKPRSFLLYNIHDPAGPRVFGSRWALNYLAGPLTRAQIPMLVKGNEVKRNMPARKEDGEARQAAPPARPTPLPSIPIHPLPATPNPPSLPPAVSQYYLPVTLTFQRALALEGGAFQGPLEPLGLAYRPALLCQAGIRYLNRRYELDVTRRLACLAPELSGRPDWEAFHRPPFDPAGLNAGPVSGARHLPLPELLRSARGLAAYRRDFLDWVYRSATIYLLANEELGVYAAPEESEVEFRARVNRAMHAAAQPELARLAAGYDAKLAALARKIERQTLTVNRRQEAVGQRKAEQSAHDFELLASVFTRRKRSLSSSLNKRRLTQQARGELDDARKVLDALVGEHKALSAEREDALRRAQFAWQERAARVTQVPVNPYRKDIFLELFGVAWLPVYLVQARDGLIEAEAY